MRIADHAADAAALLDHLGVSRAHVAGHSSGGSIALQLAFERPDLVHTLALLEPSLFSVPSAQALLERAAPSVEAYQSGDHEGAVVGFLSLVSGLDRETCRGVIQENVPGGIAQAISDADTFFGVELPAVGAWEFGRDEAAVITQPVLSVLGTETETLWVEIAGLLRSWFPQVEELRRRRRGSLAADAASGAGCARTGLVLGSLPNVVRGKRQITRASSSRGWRAVERCGRRLTAHGVEPPAHQAGRRSTFSRMTSGCRSATCRRRNAAPSGTRFSCSQERTVSALTFSALANTVCESAREDVDEVESDAHRPIGKERGMQCVRHEAVTLGTW